jgi:hypothetical protein
MQTSIGSRSLMIFGHCSFPGSLRIVKSQDRSTSARPTRRLDLHCRDPGSGSRRHTAQYGRFAVRRLPVGSACSTAVDISSFTTPRLRDTIGHLRQQGHTRARQQYPATCDFGVTSVWGGTRRKAPPHRRARRLACLSCGRPPHTRPMASSPMRKLRKTGAVDPDEEHGPRQVVDRDSVYPW